MVNASKTRIQISRNCKMKCPYPAIAWVGPPLLVEVEKKAWRAPQEVRTGGKHGAAKWLVLSGPHGMSRILSRTLAKSNESGVRPESGGLKGTSS